MKTVADESKEEEKSMTKTPLSAAMKNGHPPMTHVSKDVLNEFMSTTSLEKKFPGEQSSAKNSLDGFDLPDFTSESDSPVTPKTNGVATDAEKSSLPKGCVSEENEALGRPESATNSKDDCTFQNALSDTEPPNEATNDSPLQDSASEVPKQNSPLPESETPTKNSSTLPTLKCAEKNINSDVTAELASNGATSSTSVNDEKENSKKNSLDSEVNKVLQSQSQKSLETSSEPTTMSEAPSAQPIEPGSTTTQSDPPSSETSTLEAAPSSESLKSKTSPESSPAVPSSKESLKPEVLKDASPFEDKVSQPGSPDSDFSSHLSLEEESLLKEVAEDIIEEGDDFFSEEKLLQETEPDKDEVSPSLIDKPTITDDSSDENKSSLNLFDDIGDMEVLEDGNSVDTAKQEKEIKKIIQNLDNTLNKVETTAKPEAPVQTENVLNEEKSLGTSESATHSKPKSLVSRSNSSSKSRHSNTDSMTLPENSNSSSKSEKRSLPRDIKESSNSSATFKMLKLADKDEENSKEMDQKSTTSKSAPPKKTINANENALTFSEALKTIARENKFLAMDLSPQPLEPTEEIPSSDINSAAPTTLTVLQPLTILKPCAPPSASTPPSTTTTTTTNSSNLDATIKAGRKRTLSESEKSMSELKKVRVFKKKSIEDAQIEDDAENNAEEVNTDLKQIMKQVENAKSMETRLQEDKALHKAQDEKEKTLDKERLVFVDKEELERRTVQEMRKANLGNSKLKRIKRKDLESLVIELFVDKVLYEHQLGQQKDLCKRLEATLETNRKKSAQFHKEIEDLKKVTQRLQTEHLARKSQVIAPVKVKRSVGIQATPTIIGKGLMHASSYGTIRVLSPSNPGSIGNNGNSQVRETNTQKSTPLKQNPQNAMNQNPKTLTPLQTAPCTLPPTSTIVGPVMNAVRQAAPLQQQPRVYTSQPLNMPSQPNGPTSTQMLMVNPLVVQQSQNGVGSPILPVGATRLVRTPLTPLSSSQLASSAIATTTFTAASLPGGSPASKTVSSDFIDLTDDEEAAKGRAAVQSGGVLAIQRSAGVNLGQSPTGQFVALNTPSSVSQLVLMPSTPGQPPTALVVSSMANNTQQTMPTGVNSGVKSATIIPSAPGVRFTTPTAIVNTSRVLMGTQVNGGNFVSHIPPRHPAPLPRAPPQQTSGFSKKLPPVPVLKLSHKDNSIVLSWNMAKTDEHERIASYQLYAYQEGVAPPTPSLWKKVGSVKALELPMACTLTQFMPGHVYHFAVRAVDIRSRLGPFSDPRSIRLGK